MKSLYLTLIILALFCYCQSFPAVVLQQSEKLTAKTTNDDGSYQFFCCMYGKTSDSNDNFDGQQTTSDMIDPKTDGKFQPIDPFQVVLQNNVECAHGIEGLVFQQCVCNEGFTGSNCETRILQFDDSNNTRRRGTHENAVKLGQNSATFEDKCIHGIPVYRKMCFCVFDFHGDADPIYPKYVSDPGSEMYSGPGIASSRLEESGSGIQVGSAQSRATTMVNTQPIQSLWLENEIDMRLWTDWSSFLMPYKELAMDHHTLENQFAVVSTGIKGTRTELHYSNDQSKQNNIYRFSFAPQREGLKSRLELTTCFMTLENAINLFGTPKLNPSMVSNLVTACPVVHQPIDAIHSYDYEMYFPRGNFPTRGQYILTQWHGSADPTVVKDEFGCTARLSNFDMWKMCKRYNCKEGSVFDNEGRYVGLQYVHGGYPPLTLSFDEGEFLVIARSDERVFTEKGGCGWNKSQPAFFRCPLHPKQQFHLLARFPLQNFTFNSWLRFEWKIKWAEFGVRATPDNGQDPGYMLSKAWIRLSINNVSVVDWTGPCGRNDLGRVPYFKIGIYNPSGSEFPLRLYVRGYKHRHTSTDSLSPSERARVEKLAVSSRRKWPEINLNQNAISGGMTFRHVGHGGGCKLRAKVDHVAQLMRTRFSRLKVNKLTLDFLKTMTYAIEAHDRKIRQLEKLFEEKGLKLNEAERVEGGSEVPS